MTEAIAATLHSYKSLATRKQLQITLEVPAEYAAQALKMLGVGDPGESQWFALAKLAGRQPAALIGDDEKPAVPPTKPKVAEKKTVEAEVQKERTPFDKLPRSQQAALKCQDPEFQKYVLVRSGERPPEHHSNPERSTVHVLKIVLGISSRRELDEPGSRQALAWDRLMTDYSVRGMVR